MSEFTPKFEEDDQDKDDISSALRRIDPEYYTGSLIRHSQQRIEEVAAGKVTDYDPSIDNDYLYRDQNVIDKVQNLDRLYTDAIEAYRKLIVARRDLLVAQKAADKAVGRMFIDAHKTLTSDTMTAFDFELSAKSTDDE